MRHIAPLLLIVALLPGCSEEYKARKADEALWHQAVAADTLDAYTAFADQHPASAYHAEALQRISDIRSVEFRERFAAQLGHCAGRLDDPDSMAMLFISEERLIDLDSLRNDYHWDDSLGKLWKWSPTQAGVKMPNGSIFMLAPDTTNPLGGIAYTMGFGGIGFGGLCIDNLQIVGPVTFVEEGLRFGKDSLLIFPE